MQSTLLGVAVIGGSTLYALLGVLIVRKYFSAELLKSHHEVGGYLMSILGTLYAVVLGFVVVTVSQDVQDSKVNMGREVNALMNINRFADLLPEKEKKAIKTSCLNYTIAVANEEWEDMPKGVICPSAWRGIRNIWIEISKSTPVTPKEQAIYSQMLTEYATLADSRRIRLVTAPGTVSGLLWTVLVVGGIITISFTFFFCVDSLASQLLMTSFVAVALSLNLYLVVINSKPFSGDFKVQPTSFRRAIKLLELNGEIPDREEAKRLGLSQ
jgi:Protein of unknown function (DUF4239)